VSIVLFTRDLRLRDHPAVRAAARHSDRVVPAFVIDDRLVCGRPGPNRLAFLLESLRDLDRSLRDRGSALVIRRGDFVTEGMRLANECHAEAVFMSEDVSGYARSRRRRLERACEDAGLPLRTFEGVTVIPPGELTPASDDHYRVFTPYWRAWRTATKREVLGAPRKLRSPPRLRQGRVPPLADLTREDPANSLPPGGESAGRDLLSRWLRNGARQYVDRGDDLPADATSHLSPYLHFGCLSANEILARVDKRKGLEEFARQLCWRDFHHQVMAARPDIPDNPYRKRDRRWKSPRGRLDAWKEGRTGYPIVDAGMRQLADHGFLPNRARLIVASFLTKTLDIDWRAGAIHFESLLVDGDLANKLAVGGGHGQRHPAEPRAHPIRQAHRFDPDGAYVRRFVPELARLEGRTIHEPWRADPAERERLDYPEPLVPPPN
jgi:deoxyribodipyrimidine photo-lyase